MAMRKHQKGWLVYSHSGVAQGEDIEFIKVFIGDGAQGLALEYLNVHNSQRRSVIDDEYSIEDVVVESLV